MMAESMIRRGFASYLDSATMPHFTGPISAANLSGISPIEQTPHQKVRSE